MTKTTEYLHGYDQGEKERLIKQALFLEHKVFSTIDYSSVKNLLEVGCGVGAQSEIIMRRYPKLKLTGIEISKDHINRAESYLATKPYCSGRYEILEMDAAKMDFNTGDKFDGAHLCWVLEHMKDPKKVLSEVKRVIKPGSLVTISEVLNSTFFLEPHSPNVLRYWMRYNNIQYDMGGDPFVGAKLGNLLLSLGYSDIKTKIKTFHFDNRHPIDRSQMLDYWTDLLMSAVHSLLENDDIEESDIDLVIDELNTVKKDPNSVFYYSFVQATAYT